MFVKNLRAARRTRTLKAQGKKACLALQLRACGETAEAKEHRDLAAINGLLTGDCPQQSRSTNKMAPLEAKPQRQDVAITFDQGP